MEFYKICEGDTKIGHTHRDKEIKNYNKSQVNVYSHAN